MTDLVKELRELDLWECDRDDAADLIGRAAAALEQADVLHRGLLDAGARATAEAAGLRDVADRARYHFAADYECSCGYDETSCRACSSAESAFRCLEKALSPPGPGAALLERLQKAEREVESLNSDIVYAADRWAKAEQQVETLTRELDDTYEDAWTSRNRSEDLLKERDELKAKLAEADRMRASDPRWLYDALRAMTERTEKAEARVAKLRKALNSIAWQNTETWARDCAKQALEEDDKHGGER